MKILILGAGAWGSALAVSACAHPQGHHVTLWARDSAQAAAMQNQRENQRYLPGVVLPNRLDILHWRNFTNSRSPWLGCVKALKRHKQTTPGV